jgi:hypothetical protein
MQEIAVERIVVVAEEHLFAPIAPLGDVMWQNREPQTGRFAP